MYDILFLPRGSFGHVAGGVSQPDANPVIIITRRVSSSVNLHNTLELDKSIPTTKIFAVIAILNTA